MPEERPHASELSGFDNEHLDPATPRTVNAGHGYEAAPQAQGLAMSADAFTHDVRREGYGDQRVNIDPADEAAVQDLPMGRTPMDDLRDEVEGGHDQV